MIYFSISLPYTDLLRFRSDVNLRIQHFVNEILFLSLSDQFKFREITQNCIEVIEFVTFDLMGSFIDVSVLVIV